MSADPFDLQRFVDAQSHCYADALAEIRRGARRSHWMWFIFPQIAGLGHSAMAQHYAITSAREAQAYLTHPVLGPRLRVCVAALQDVSGLTAEQIFGGVDAIKLRSSLTLFAQVSEEAPFAAALDRWFAGERDAMTLALLQSAS